MTGGWERLAAFEGGTVTALASATAADGTRHLFAATPVGVFRSTDRGLSWHPLGGASRVPGVEVVTPSPRFAEDGILFAGAYDGLYRWREGGTGWGHLLSGSQVLSVACSPGDGNTPADGSGLTLLVGTADDGVLIGRDGGRTWSGANPGLLDLTVFALALSPEFERDGTAFAGTSSGLYRTRNGAESWREAGLDGDDVAVLCLGVSPRFAADRTVLAGTEEHGLLRSDDAGRSWQAVDGLAEALVNDVTWMADGQIVAATDAGLALSTDGGQTWRQVGADLGGVASGLLVQDVEAAVLLAGLPATETPRHPGLPDGGVARSVDGGQTWQAANDGLTAHLVVDLALSPRFEHDATVLVASLNDGVRLSHDGGRTWGRRPAALDGRAAQQIETWASPAGDGAVLASTDGGLFLSHDAGATWAALPGDGASAPASAVAVAADPAAATILAALPDGRLLATADQGTTWTALEPPPARGTVAGLAISPAFERDGTLFVVLAGPSAQDETCELTVWRTASRGRRWDRWLSVPALPGGTAIRVVALPPNRFGDVLVVGLGERVFRPRQGSWEIVGGARRPAWDVAVLAGGELTGRQAAISALAASPEYPRDRTLFAATSSGVFVSRDGGGRFTAWNVGLEPLATVAVVPSPAFARDGLVYVLGLGGTVWRRQDR